MSNKKLDQGRDHMTFAKGVPVSIAGISESIDCYAGLAGVERLTDSSVHLVI